jgi:3-oxoacyl-[acyl-carrier-protein] synthase-3
MKSLRKVMIAGTGSYLPARVLRNEDLEKLVDTSDEWIRRRTGIRERRVVAEGEATSDMAFRASRVALETAGVSADQVDLILLATMTPDTIMPSTAARLQAKLGARKAGGFDIVSACTGFVFALATGWQYVASGNCENVLVVGAETMTSVTDFTDRTTCIIFGDGAGAVLLRESRNGESDILSCRMRVEGDDEIMSIPAGGARIPPSHESVETRQHYMKIQGRKAFRFAVGKFVELVKDALEGARLRSEELALIVPHQVNRRIIEAAATRLSFPMERIAVNIDRVGNTSAASIPIAFDEAVRAVRLRRGDPVLFAAFGGGLSWGSVLLRY